MAIGKKWIKARKPHSRASKVAIRALESRLKSVLHYLPLAAKKPREDVEYVHQLRVATRRAGAALRAFAEMASKRRTGEIKKGLRLAHRAASAARDLDVILMWLADGRWPETLLFVRKLRNKSQIPLRQARQKLKRRKFSFQARKLVRSVRWRADNREPKYAEFARSALRPSVNDFFAAAAKDLSDTEALHALRIAGKQLRYDMELYAGVFDEAFRSELYVVIQDVQNQLGEINDHATASALFAHWRESLDNGPLATELEELIELEQMQINQTVEQFCQWWTPDRANELLQSFEHFIAPANQG